MESWEVVGGREKTTKAAGQGLRPKPSVGLLGGPNREQGGRSGGEPPKNGATRHGFPGLYSKRVIRSSSNALFPGTNVACHDILC